VEVGNSWDKLSNILMAEIAASFVKLAMLSKDEKLFNSDPYIKLSILLVAQGFIPNDWK
jgi:hypothetical protein